MKNLIKKIQKANLVGRGGATFPTAIKWEAVRKKKSKLKYVICNASEGELAVFKDIYILEHYPEKVFQGLKIAMDYLNTKEAYFNFNENYYKKVGKKIEQLIKRHRKEGYHFQVFKEKPSYAGGEETALLNAIEGKRVQPRMKPPYPSQKGLFGYPTLIHNVETLINIADVANGTFENKRYYSISGTIKNPGVYHYPADWSVYKILEATNNIPKFGYFVQIGGSASGIVLNQNQIKIMPTIGAGAIEVYNAKTSPKKILTRWFEFYDHESCGKCAPCREGTYQLHKLIKNNKEIPWQEIMEIIHNMETTSFCALGKSIAIPVKSYLKNILQLCDMESHCLLSCNHH